MLRPATHSNRVGSDSSAVSAPRWSKRVSDGEPRTGNSYRRTRSCETESRPAPLRSMAGVVSLMAPRRGPEVGIDGGACDANAGIRESGANIKRLGLTS